MIKGYIACDFDGTIVEHCFPDIGPEIPGAINTLKRLKLAGYRLILFTVRENGLHGDGRQYLTEAVKWCADRGLHFDAINTTPTEADPRKMGGGRKVCADIMIDDRSFGGLIDWAVIEAVLLRGEKMNISIDGPLTNHVLDV